MDVTAVDPRDTRWEIDHPTYRVNIWSRLPAPEHVGPAAQAWSCGTYDVTDADVEEVLAWAREGTPSDGTYTVFLRGVDSGEQGLFRLAGWEPTRPDASPGYVM